MKAVVTASGPTRPSKWFPPVGAGRCVSRQKMVDVFERPKEPKLRKTAEEKATGRRVIVVLTKAALETVKTKRGFELLNAEYVFPNLLYYPTAWIARLNSATVTHTVNIKAFC